MQEWYSLCAKHTAANGDPHQGWRYRKCKQAHREGSIGWQTNQDGIAAVPMLYSPDAAEAYTDRRFIPAHALHVRVLSEVARELGPGFAPTKVLDFGCGPGAGLAAAAQVWESSVCDIIGVDNSSSMLAIAEILLGPEEGPVASQSARLHLESTLANVVGGEATAQSQSLGVDLVLISGTLSELRTDIERAATVDSLWACLAEGGVLVVLEHGGAIGGHVVRRVSLRSILPRRTH